jgi:Amt family ammonium transporter
VEFELPLLLEDIAEMFAHRAASKGLELTCHILRDVPRVMRGDPERLRQVLINLVNNALKFTERGEVTMRAEVHASGSGQTLRLCVRDTGIGIPPERVSRLFSPFSQVDASTTRKYGGTGLGLAICRQLIELMGGKVGVESQLGQGSTFWCELPITSVPDAKSARMLDAEQLRGVRVLVVDDMPTNLEILETQLGGWGFQVTTLREPQSALNLLLKAVSEKQPYQLLILDHQMPGLDGMQLAGLVRRESALENLTLLMLTSLDSLTSEDERKTLRFAGVMTKPIRQSRLYDTIVSALQPRLAHEAFTPAQRELGQSDKGNETRAVIAGGAKILVAEDNEINQIVTGEILRGAGYSCEVVGNGRLAIQALMRERYDLVLMDCQMPELDGFAATSEIRAREAEGGLAHLPRPLPIIALTANAVQGDRELCLNAGMTDYTTKPIEREILLKKILEHLQRQEANGAAERASNMAAPNMPGAVERQSPDQHAAEPNSKDQRPAQETEQELVQETEAEQQLEGERSESVLALPELLERCSGQQDLAERVLK